MNLTKYYNGSNSNYYFSSIEGLTGTPDILYLMALLKENGL